jgi:hypothetical protein
MLQSVELSARSDTIKRQFAVLVICQDLAPGTRIHRVDVLISWRSLQAAEEVGMNVKREAPRAKAELWRIPGAIDPQAVSEQ